MNHDRYCLREFMDFQRGFTAGLGVEQHKLGDLLRQSTLTYTSSKGIDHFPLTALPLRLHLENSTSANVGRTLIDLGLELRRSVAYLNNGSARPCRDNEIVDVISARSVSSIDLVIAAGMEIYTCLTLRPLDFLQILDWFWSHRHSFTKVRPADRHIDPTGTWKEMVEMAKSGIELGRSVVVTADVVSGGKTKFGFASF